MQTSYLGQIYTPNGHNLLTAVNGGGLGGTAPGVALHTDAAAVGAWETFKLILQPGSPPIGSPGMKFALQTSNANYVTAINAGGVGGPNDATCPIHTDTTIANAWEGFILQIDDSVNPPTVAIRTQTGNFVTAVNGGGVNGGNTQPISYGCYKCRGMGTVSIQHRGGRSAHDKDLLERQHRWSSQWQHRGDLANYFELKPGRELELLRHV